MGFRAGRQVAPLGAALLITLAACAQPPAGTANGVSTGALRSGTPTSALAGPSATASSATSGATAAAAPSATALRDTTSAPPITAASTAVSTPVPAPVTSGAGEAVSPLPSCSAPTLPTSVRGTLTLAFNGAAGVPWFIGDPVQGKGFEAAVGTAVARQLGFAADRVRWKPAAAGDVQGAKVPGADVGLGEFRTPDQGGGPVDYSTGYFSISDSVVARVGSPAARVTGLPALGKLRVASLARPVAGAGRLDSPSEITYPNNAAALAALRRGAVDVAVVPTPAAVTAGPDIAVLGQLSRPTEQPAQFGMVLPKNSKLTACVSAAIDQLRVTGALTALVQRWVPAANKTLK